MNGIQHSTGLAGCRGWGVLIAPLILSFGPSNSGGGSCECNGQSDDGDDGREGDRDDREGRNHDGDDRREGDEPRHGQHQPGDGAAIDETSLDEVLEALAVLGDGGTDVTTGDDRDEELARLTERVDELAAALATHESALEGTRSLTSAVVDSIDDVFVLLEPDGTLRRWNDRLLANTTYDRETIESMDALGFFPEDERERVERAIERALETGHEQLSIEARSTDGERIPYEFALSSVETNGDPLIAAIGRNTTERDRHRRELQERERQLSTLMNNIPGMVYRCVNHPDWPMEFVSNGARELTGYRPEELVDGDVVWSEDVIATDNERLWAAVQRQLEAGEPFQVTYPIRTEGGEQRWCKEQGRGVYDEDGTLEALEGVIIDVTDRVESERALERTRDFLQQTQRLATVGGWELDSREDLPPEVVLTTEARRILGIDEHDPLHLEAALELFHPEDRPRLREAVESATDHGMAYDLEARLDRPDGDQRWVRTIGDPVETDDEVVAVRGSIQDITERKTREQALESLHEATRNLLQVTERGEAATLVAETAERVLGVAGASVYALEASTNALVALSQTEGFPSTCDPDVPVRPGDDSVLWQTFLDGAPTVFDGQTVAAGSPVFGPTIEAGMIVPIGDHGVFVVANDRPLSNHHRQLAETMVASLEAAFDRLESEADLRERDRELATQNRRLTRQIRINDVIRRIDQSLVTARSRTEVEEAVCTRLAESDLVTFAWIGSLETGTDRVVARVWAGDGEGYLDAVSLEVAVDWPEPAAKTAREGAPTVVESVASTLDRAEWRRRALGYDFGSCLAVPIAIDAYTYGVLAVYAAEPSTFGDLEQTVFAELGGSIANAITAVETRAALQSDAHLEIDLHIEGEDLFTRLVDAVGGDCTVSYEGLGGQVGDDVQLFVEVSGASAADVEAAMDGMVAVTAFQRLGKRADGADDDGRGAGDGEDTAPSTKGTVETATPGEGQPLHYECKVSGPLLATRLLRHGANPQSIRATGSGLEATVDLPTTANVREFVEVLADHYDTVELRGRRHVDRQMHTRSGFVTDLFDHLTDRQREVLRVAYYAGFFEWPRESTGQEVAAMLGVSQPTVNRHLRLAQGRLLAELFEASGTGGPTDLESVDE